jgi:hypothetical protein
VPLCLFAEVQIGFQQQLVMEKNWAKGRGEQMTGFRGKPLRELSRLAN